MRATGFAKGCRSAVQVGREPYLRFFLRDEIGLNSNTGVIWRHDPAAHTGPPHALHIAFDDGPVGTGAKGSSRAEETTKHVHHGGMRRLRRPRAPAGGGVSMGGS